MDIHDDVNIKEINRGRSQTPKIKKGEEFTEFSLNPSLSPLVPLSTKDNAKRKIHCMKDNPFRSLVCSVSLTNKSDSRFDLNLIQNL